MMTIDQINRIIILYSDGELTWPITGVLIVSTMIIYGDEQVINHLIIGERTKQIPKIDSDHVQQIIIFLVHENGVFY